MSASQRSRHMKERPGSEATVRTGNRPFSFVINCFIQASGGALGSRARPSRAVGWAAWAWPLLLACCETKARGAAGRQHVSMWGTL